MKLTDRKKTSSPMLRVCAAVGLALSAATATADDIPQYRVAAIKDTAFGDRVLSEDYNRAIELLERREGKGIDAFYRATNLCVAYIKTGALEEAEASCNSAVERIENFPAVRGTTHSPQERDAARRLHAVALSNRGVAYAVSGQDELAQADFEAAGNVESRLKEPAINLARLTLAKASGD
jgi:tetratricopeptide (TPR) repeat protein